MKRMKKEVGRIQGITLTFTIYRYLLCCLQNPGQNVLPGWMGLRELVHSCFFLPLHFFALLLSAPLPCSLPGATKLPSPVGPRWQRGGCGREKHLLLPTCHGDLGPRLLPTQARNRVSHAALQHFAVSDQPLGPRR